MTLLQIAVDAYNDHIARHDYDISDDEAPMGAVLRALAGYIRTNHYRSEGRAIAVLFDAAAGPEPQPEPYEPHPSLTPQERNPNLK